MSREIFDHKDFNGIYDVAARANKFITWADGLPLSDQPLPPPMASDAIDFMTAICRFVGGIHTDQKTEDEARRMAKKRMDDMDTDDLRVLTEEAMIFDYRLFPGELESDLHDEKESQ